MEYYVTYTSMKLIFNDESKKLTKGRETRPSPTRWELRKEAGATPAQLALEEEAGCASEQNQAE